MVRAELVEDGVLKLYLDGLVTVMAYTGDAEAPTQKVEYKFALVAKQ